MTPKEKAKELVDMFQYDITEPQDYIRMSEDDAIESALICVNEMIKNIIWSSDFNGSKRKELEEVKQEINKL